MSLSLYDLFSTQPAGMSKYTELAFGSTNMSKWVTTNLLRYSNIAWIVFAPPITIPVGYLQKVDSGVWQMSSALGSLLPEPN